MKLNKKPIKIRKFWTRHPVERVRDSNKSYDRRKAKQELEGELREFDNEIY